LAKTQGSDLGEYVLLAALIALIIGVVVVHVVRTFSCRKQNLF